MNISFFLNSISETRYIAYDNISLQENLNIFC